MLTPLNLFPSSAATIIRHCMSTFFFTAFIYIFSRRVNHRAHQLKISFHHEAPAYLDQDYPITIEVTNIDIRDLDVVVNILLQPTEIDDAGMVVVLLVVLVI